MDELTPLVPSIDIPRNPFVGGQFPGTPGGRKGYAAGTNDYLATIGAAGVQLQGIAMDPTVSWRHGQ